MIQRAVEGIQRIMDIAEQCIPEGRPEEIASRVLAGNMPEVEKLMKARGEVLYNYSRNELITDHSTYFAHYYLDIEKKTTTSLNISFT